MITAPSVRPPARRPAFLARFAAAVAAAAVSLSAAAMPEGPAAAQGADRQGLHAGRHGALGEGMAMPFGHPRRAGRLLDAIDATPEQRTQIRTLLDAAQRDLQAEQEAGRGLRQQAMALFAQPAVDARAAEALRQQMLGHHDSASKRMTQLMLDVSRVLSPAQRQQLAERMAQRRDLKDRHPRERRTPERPQG
jgi:Spy/CpxP family protein refolding chaperone